ncbi:magnesium transporter [Sphingomicrobium sediminis]|uniref:Magnesium transporter MgtE n=1 Tax=Sphingomicrobium sediminis TaxID=2950949 RepID=A0A9X2EM30_9SPHN|nr:magnesium transporter [Sphingomicrobium sediminis]MCM8557879.1 magnesium transporter [Sphingomicrobium sediminis]
MNDTSPPLEEDLVHDAEDRLRPDFVKEVLDDVREGRLEEACSLVAELHPADRADLVELAPEADRADLIAALGSLLDADVYAEMNEHVRELVVEEMEPEQAAELTGDMETDDAVALLEDLDDDDQRAILDVMEPDDRAAIEEALSYPEESAGRIMQRDLIAVPEHWNVGQVIDYMRSDEELADDFWEVFVVGPLHHPVGTTKLSTLLRTKREVPIADIMQEEQTLIPVDMDQEEVALKFQKYALISAAVVDPSGRLVGMITVDDIVHIIQEEAGEDALLLSGAGEGDINEPVREAYSGRIRWLIANLGTALLATFVIAQFEDTIARLAILAALMPIVAALGGNAGTQALAVTVRALATNQLTGTNRARAIRREFFVALLNGVTIAIILGIGVAIFLDPMIGVVIGAAILFNILVAGLAGVLVPVILDRFGADPAVASSVFVTTVTDTMGFLAFLGLASAVLL